MLVVRSRMRFQRRGGRKRIVAPDGSEIVPASKPQPDGALLKALARAAVAGMLEECRLASVRELAEAERVSLSYVSRNPRLVLLAPEIVEWIMDGRWAPQPSQLMLPFPGRVGEATRDGDGLHIRDINRWLFCNEAKFPGAAQVTRNSLVAATSPAGPRPLWAD